MVSLDYNETVLDTKKDVFVMFTHRSNVTLLMGAQYQKFFHAWHLLADHYKDRDDVVIAYIDGDMNEIPGIYYDMGFQCVFYGKNNKKPLRY